MRRAALIAAVQAAAVLAAGQAAAQVVSDRPDAVAVTVYREGDIDPESRADLDWFTEGGLALISETRTLDLPAGRQRISFRGVAERMVPETAALEGLPGETAERNYDFDLLSPGGLLARSIGERVRLVRTNRATGTVEEQEAIVRSGPTGVVLQTAAGVEALSCGGLTERVVFDRVPEGLSDRATLSAVVDVLNPGRHTVRLSYLATGFNWAADYVARLSPDGRSLDLAGWVTLANGGDTSFANAPTQVVAGTLSRDVATRAPKAVTRRIERRCWPDAQVRPVASRIPAPARVTTAGFMDDDLQDTGVVDEVVVTASRLTDQSDLGDYKLYTLPEPTTVAAHQIKQVRFLEQVRVPVERVYVASVRLDELHENGEAQGATILLRMKNDRAGGLGKPLPAGAVAVTERDARGGAVLAGEASLRDTAVGLPVELEIGRAIDVTVVPRLVAETDLKRWGRERVRHEVEVELANAKAVPVMVEVAHDPRWGDSGLRVVSESGRHVMKDGAPLWRVALKAGERRVIRYALEVDGD